MIIQRWIDHKAGTQLFSSCKQRTCAYIESSCFPSPNFPKPLLVGKYSLIYYVIEHGRSVDTLRNDKADQTSNDGETVGMEKWFIEFMMI